MAIVRFAEICDHCKRRSAEYSCWHSCRECMECVCDTCSTNQDDESGKADCRRCKEVERLANIRASEITNGEKRASQLTGITAEMVWDAAADEEKANRQVVVRMRRKVAGAYAEVEA